MEGRVALICGAGEGIGRACATVLGREGASVVVAARTEDRLRRLADEVAADTGRPVLAVPVDLSDVANGAKLVDTTIAAFGRIDAVVNVFTTSGTRGRIDDADWDGYRRAFELNVIATMEISRAAAAHMQGHGGAIVQISTLGVHSMQEQQAAYTATKSAMMVASFTMAREVGRHGVRVNVVTPGYVTGDDLDRMWAGIAARTGADPADVSAKAAKGAALKRHVDPVDIAEAVAFLVSDRGRNVTGIELRVDAGQWVG